MGRDWTLKRRGEGMDGKADEVENPMRISAAAVAGGGGDGGGGDENGC